MAEIDVQKLRKAYGESQTLFAIRAGVAQSTLCAWEKNGPPKQGSARKVLEQLAADAPKPKARAA